MSKIGDYMSTPVLTTSPDTLAFDAIGKMFENKVGALLVEKNGEYIHWNIFKNRLDAPVAKRGMRPQCC